MKSRESFSDDSNMKILLIGNTSRAFLNPDYVKDKYFEAIADAAHAVKTAASGNYTAIAVVMSGFPDKLTAALKTLRDKCNSKIILLARMYEEPMAIRLVQSAYNDKTLADDYLICPVRPDEIYGLIANPPAETGPKSSSHTIAEATIEARIKQLEKLATEDDLTGLKNRRYIWEFSRQIIERAGSEPGQVTLLVFDIDNFKHYNDIYGHFAGDEILKQAAVLMKRCCRGHDVVGRIGGDEFAVLFWDGPKQKSAAATGKPNERRSITSDHPKEVISIAQRFVKELENTELSSLGGLGPKGKGTLTISGGMASFPRDGKTIQELFQQADRALLDAKRSGKNRIYLVGKPQNNINDID